ncbi:MAG: oxidoreductase [Gemmatimonadota bacterium]|nr:oxidoreductase [Gemmatimonadota bacterium]
MKCARAMAGVALLVAMTAAAAEAQEATSVPGVAGEFRGMSARGDVVWASGRAGTYARSTDGGVTWEAGVIPGAETLFLVDVEALDARAACVLATSFDAGVGRIYRTPDGGATWSVAYEFAHPEVFFDGLAFWDADRGVAFSDPVDGAFLVVRTTNGCGSWTEVPRKHLPTPLEGEAGFAASGTAIAVAGTRHAWIGTGGGAVARVLLTTDSGATWTARATPMAAGPATGIFGIAFRDTLHGVAVGGNYQRPGSAAPNVLRTGDGGRTWAFVGTTAPPGVRYGAVYVPGSGTVVAGGPTGFGLSDDDGATWTAVDSAFTYGLTATGAAGWVAGPGGRIVRLGPDVLRKAR